MVQRNVPVECAGVKVRDGDIVFGDVDGVVVVPQERAAEVLARANEKVAGEGRTRDELRQGRLLREVFEKYRIL
jgi:regulator of RNase E activity RraA